MPLTIDAASVNTLIANPSDITGYDATKAIVIEGQISTTQASQLATVVSPSITATVQPAAASVLSAITVRSGRTNAFTLTPTETSATAAVLKGVKDKTSLNGNFANVTTISASPAADIIALFAPTLANGTSANTTFAANITIKVNDITAAASDLVAINKLSTTDIDADDTTTTITGGAADVALALGAGVAHKDNVAVTITEATTAAADLEAIALTGGNGLTTGLVTVQSSRVTGVYADVNPVLAASALGTKIAGMGAINVTLANTAGTHTVTPTEINTIDGLTTGTITATTAAATKAVLHDGTNGLQLLDHAHNITIPAITDASISAEELNGIDAKTTVDITTNATTITGAPAAIVTAYASSSIKGLGNEAITPTGAITVTQANSLNALTPGVVTATISDTSEAALAGLTDNSVAVDNAYTITPAGTFSAAALTALNAKTSEDIDATNITTLTGTLAEVAEVYTSTGTQAGITNILNKAVTISDTGSLDADLFAQINGRTTNAVTVSGTVTNLTGSAANIKQLFVDKIDSTPVDTVFTDNPTVTITGATAAAADLISINGDTTGTITVNAAEISGSKNNIDTVLAANAATPADGDTITGIAVTGANAINLDISDAVVINSLPTYTALTTGNITATVTETNISTLLTDANKAKMGTGNKLSFSVTGSTVAGPAASNDILAADLIALKAIANGGSIKATVAGSIKGSIADLKTVYNANTALNGGNVVAGSIFAGLEAEPMVVSDSIINAADLTYLTAKNGALGVTHDATHVTGTKAEIIAVYTADEAGATIAGTDNATILTVTDTSISATDLDAVNAKSNAAVTFTGTTLSGTGDQLEDALLRNIGKKWNGNRDAQVAATNEFLAGLDAVNLSATALTPTEINFLEDYTTGTITAGVTGASATALLTGAANISTLSRVHNLAITVTDASFTAANIAALTAKTSGTVTINSATITGNSSQLLAAYTASATAVAGLGNENIMVTGGISVADLNTLASKTEGIITATITDTSAATLKTIAESGHSLTINIGGTTVAATDVIAIDALTASDVTVGATTAISGTLAEIEAVQALATATTTVLPDNPLTFTEPLTRAQANVQHLTTAGTITATISDTTHAELSQLTGTGANANAYTFNLSETSLTGAQLIAINDRTSVPVNASSVTTITGTAAHIATCLVENTDFAADGTTASPRTITGLDSVVVTPTAGQEATIAQLKTIESRTTGLVTLTLNGDGTDADSRNLAVLAHATNGIQESTNKINITVHNDGGSRTISAGKLKTLLGLTTGLVTVTAANTGVNMVSGSIADLKEVYAANQATNATVLTGLLNQPATITFATGADTTLAATDLNTLNGLTGTGVVTFSNATQLTGVGTLDANGGSAVKTALDAMVANEVSYISGVTADVPPVTLTGNVSVADVNVISGLTGGAVTATISDGTMAALNTLRNEAGNAYTITITDTTADGGDLHTLNGLTTVAVNAAALTSITGTRTEIDNVYAADAADPKTITGLGNENITISTANLTRTQINTAAAYTTGSLKASVAADSMADYGTIAESGNELALDVTDATVVAATLNNFRTMTTGVVNVQAGTINGSLSDIAALYADQTAGTVSGLGAETIGITNTGTVSAADLNVIDGINATAFSAATVTGLTGTAAAVKAALASTGITGLGTQTVTITGTATATDIVTVNNGTTGLVTVNASTITGTQAELVALYSSTAGTAGLGDEAVTITDAVTTAQANVIDAYTNGVVTATISDGAIDNLANLTGTNNAYTINVTDTTVSASNLNALNSKTTQSINVLSTGVSGTAAELIATYAAKGAGTLSGLGSETVTVTSAGKSTVATASDLGLITFDATSYLASHTDVLAAYGSTGNSALTHYLDYGYSESRSKDSFSELSYIASYSDLITAFGTNGTAGTAHFVSNGYSEGRSADKFDELGYVASYADLITVIGSSATGAATHYINYGSTEGRTATFDATSYLAKYADLSAAFGSDQELAKKHYIDFGYSEGRTVA